MILFFRGGSGDPAPAELEGYVDLENASADPEGGFQFVASACGDYRVEFRVRLESDIRGVSLEVREVPLVAGATLTIEEGTRSVQHSIVPDPTEYANALAKLGR